MKLDCITVTKILRCFRTSGCRKSRNRFQNKNVLSWQNILSRRQIAADIEEKWANHREILFFFFYQGFLSRTLTTHRTAGEGRVTTHRTAGEGRVTTHRTAGEGRGSRGSRGSRGRERDHLIPIYHFHPLTNIETFICNFAREMIITYF